MVCTLDLTPFDVTPTL